MLLRLAPGRHGMEESGIRGIFLLCAMDCSAASPRGNVYLVANRCRQYGPRAVWLGDTEDVCRFAAMQDGAAVGVWIMGSWWQVEAGTVWGPLVDSFGTAKRSVGGRCILRRSQGFSDGMIRTRLGTTMRR
jgi:hypothetical protein